MNMRNLIHQINQPCAMCPYRLGLVHTVVNPCPQCEENGYQMYEHFQGKNTQGRNRRG